MTSFWDHLYQYAQEHLVVRYLQEEPTGYGRLSIQTDARRRGLEDLLRGPAARSFRRLWEEQQELHSLEEQALFRAGLSMGLALGGRVRDQADYQIPGTEITHRVVAIEKVAPTLKGYPRRWAKIQKEPL